MVVNMCLTPGLCAACTVTGVKAHTEDQVLHMIVTMIGMTTGGMSAMMVSHNLHHHQTGGYPQQAAYLYYGTEQSELVRVARIVQAKARHIPALACDSIEVPGRCHLAASDCPCVPSFTLPQAQARRWPHVFQGVPAQAGRR